MPDPVINCQCKLMLNMILRFKVLININYSDEYNITQFWTVKAFSFLAYKKKKKIKKIGHKTNSTTKTIY